MQRLPNMGSLPYRQFVMRKKGLEMEGGWREGETEMVEGIGIRQNSRNNASCIKKINAVCIWSVTYDLERSLKKSLRMHL
jgi:hypothetical protein